MLRNGSNRQFLPKTLFYRRYNAPKMLRSPNFSRLFLSRMHHTAVHTALFHWPKERGQGALLFLLLWQLSVVASQETWL